MRIFGKIFRCMAILTAAVLLPAGCGASTEDNGTESESAKARQYDFSYTDRELDASYDENNASKIVLTDGDVSVSGSGASADGSVVTIGSEGTYLLSGKLSDGQIIVDTPDDEKVQLVFDGVDISCSDNAPILIYESDKVFLTLADGSSNTLTGPSAYSEEAVSDSVDGVIFSKADLCINGGGSLVVTASSGHGVVSKDDFVVTGGNIDVTAAGDGLQGKDCVKIKDGTFTINAENDGIKSSNAQDDERGFVSIDGGKFTLDAGYDGLQAETLLRVAGGDFDITTGGGSQYASTQDDWGASWGGGNNQRPPGEMMTPGGGQMSDDGADTSSAKGLKGNLEVLILDGSFSINSSDDSIHSNGDVTIQDGNITLTSGDDGIHADSNLSVKGGTLDVTQSYEGMEGNTITIKDGNIDITASDDGLNAAGGADGSSIDGRAGQDPFSVDESAFIKINGGTLNISASGDGIDSNGSLDITDGYITVSCPAMGDTAVLDYASEGNITGGTFIGTGAAQMAQTFSSSEQGLISVSVSEQATGSVITLTDGSGNEVMSHEAPRSFAVVILSSPDIASGETYILQAGSASGEVIADFQ